LFDYQHVRIEAMGYALPPEVVSSAELERRLQPVYDRFSLHEGRLELMTGIRERRFWERGTWPSDAAAAAGRHALEQAGVLPEQVQCLLFTAVSRDCLEPATASIAHDKLGLSDEAVVFDLSNACLGFVNGMNVLGNMIEMGQLERGLIVAGESSRQLVETTITQLNGDARLTKTQLKDAFASLTIGSGAAAMLLTHESLAPNAPRVLGGVARCATQYNDLCRGSADVGFADGAAMVMQTQAETLLVSGCALAARTWEAFLRDRGWSREDIDRCVCHQVGGTHRDQLYEAIGRDPSLDFSTFEMLGNVGSVSLPITLAMGVEADPPAAGTKVALLGIGSGLNCVMLGVEW
jgi:3-oxoacyl-[acyl-carrier-protein] synthase III